MDLDIHISRIDGWLSLSRCTLYLLSASLVRDPLRTYLFGSRVRLLTNGAPPVVAFPFDINAAFTANFVDRNGTRTHAHGYPPVALPSELIRHSVFSGLLSAVPRLQPPYRLICSTVADSWDRS